jgi:hypothetical protein
MATDSRSVGLINMYKALNKRVLCLRIYRGRQEESGKGGRSRGGYLAILRHD